MFDLIKRGYSASMRTNIVLDVGQIKMPNGQVLDIIKGELPVSFKMQPPEPQIHLPDWWPEWDVETAQIEIDCMDDHQNEIRLSMPSHDPRIDQWCEANRENISRQCEEEHSERHRYY